MTLPERMRAIEFDGAGGPEIIRLVELPLPEPGQGELLIKVAAAGVNRPDVVQREGRYPPPPGASPVPGLEVSGTVAALGEGVDSVLLGARVCALLSGGGYAEYAIAPAVQCLPVPDALSMVEAAAMPETLFTVWSNVFERAYAAPGDWLLVHGGTSGIGSMTLMLARLFGIKTITTCGSEAKCDAARGFGADHAINYRTQDFVEEVARITGQRGVDIVLDMIGGDYVPRNLKCLAEDGRHVTIAVMGGAKAEINLAQLMVRRQTLTGSTLRPRSSTFKGLVAEELARAVWPLVAEGRLRPHIDSHFPLAEARAAHERMDSGAHIGKIVLEMIP